MMDKELEEAIDQVGRVKVFDLAALNGWFPPNSPPKWIWWGIVRQLRNTNSKTVT